MPWPSWGSLRTSTRVSHFDDSDPGQPGTISRSGPPWMCGKALSLGVEFSLKVGAENSLSGVLA